MASGHEVLGLDNFSLGHESNVPDEVEFVEADASSIAALTKKLSDRNIEVIFHLAGQSGGELSFSKPIFDLESNATSTLALLQYASKFGVKKIIHASSVAVYGQSEPCEEGLTEDQEKRASSPYGISKYAAENYLRIFSQKLGLTSTSLRFFNVYGAGQDLSRLDQGMLSIYLSQGLRDKQILVKGALNRYRDFVDVRDAVIACEKSMQLDHVGHVPVNVCTGKKTEVKQALEVLRGELPFEVRVELEDSTPGDAFGWVGSVKRLRTLLDWSPQISFLQGFPEMIRAELSKSKRLENE